MARFRIAVWGAIFAGVLSIPAPAVASTPSVPLLRDVWVSGVGQVTLRWDASVDASGHAVDYDIYRYPGNITTTNFGSATLVAGGVAGTSRAVAAAPQEVADAYVWFYVVVARDQNNLRSGISRTMSPDLHGYRSGADSTNVYSCQRCHSVHGAGGLINYKSYALCYSCHGTTTAASPTGAKSTHNTQAAFGDYSGQTAPGSVHRNSFTLALTNNWCVKCHSPHRPPVFYDVNAAVNNAAGYRMMLRTDVFYSRNDNAVESGGFCLSCHGAATTYIAAMGGPTAHAASGGDHNAAAYDASAAHGSTIVKTGEAGAMPQVQCLVCHDNHASVADKLVYYRAGRTVGSTDYSGSALCFACHDAASAETTVAAGYSAPFAWNDRDVKAQFAKASKHPFTPAGTGRSAACASCHNVHFVQEGGTSDWNMARVSDPDNTKAQPASANALCLACHDGTPPETTLTASAIVPYRVGFSTVSAPYFPGWNKRASGFDYQSSGHYATSDQKAYCYMCHDPHASDFVRLTAWTAPLSADKSGTWTPNAGTRKNASPADVTLSREENLCYQCHGNGTTGKEAPGAKDVATPMAATYNHTSTTYAGRHADTETAANLGGTNRHAECVDCHDPHVARKVSGSAVHTSGSSAAGGAVFGAWAVDPTYPAANWASPTSYTPDRVGDETSDVEANLCFKCHSGNTTQPSGQTDIALQFNPSNFSFHNVLGLSTAGKSSFTVVPSGGSTTTVTWDLPTANVFKAGFNWNSKLTCTDCHTGSTADALGPHGSSTAWLIDPDYPVDWKTAGLWDASSVGIGYMVGAVVTEGNGEVICSKCHDLYGASGINGWSNQGHAGPSGVNTGRHWVSYAARRKYCIDCHVPIPHGWQRPRLLGYTTDAVDYRTTGLLQFSVTGHSLTNGAASWACTSCKATNGGVHSTNVVSPWP